MHTELLGESRVGYPSCWHITRYNEHMKYTIREPHARKYSEDNSLLRDVSETVGWECREIRGSFWTPIKRSFEHLKGMGSLEDFGFCCRFTPEIADFGLFHPLVQANKEKAQLGGKYALRLAGLRTKR